MRSEISTICAIGKEFLVTSFSAHRLLAVLPACMMGCYWLFGEMALLVLSVCVPVGVAVAAWRAFRSKQDQAVGVETEASTRFDLTRNMAPFVNHSGGKGAALAVIVDDIDALEKRFGRGAKRAIKIQAVKRLKNLLRSDDYTAFLDETSFAIGLPKLRPPETENLLRVARRLQSICDKPFIYEGARIYCSISLGVASERQIPDCSAEKLIEAAESAADFAASVGPGSVRIFSEGLTSHKEEERKWAQHLSTALETGEIFAWFQPQLSSDGTRLCGFEALARWDRPDHGLSRPDAFLPQLEQLGMSHRLTEVVLKQSLTALNAWDAAGYDVPSIAVNLAREDLRNPNLADYILWELDRFDLDPARLTLEFSETVLESRQDGVIEKTLSALYHAGCPIDLDDFGRAATKFQNIRRLNVSRLKIDRTLVKHLDEDSEERAMVAAILSFGESLNLKALAEGVETNADRRALCELGCPFIQGHLVGHPMPLGETFLWLDEFAKTKDAA